MLEKKHYEEEQKLANKLKYELSKALLLLFVNKGQRKHWNGIKYSVSIFVVHKDKSSDVLTRSNITDLVCDILNKVKQPRGEYKVRSNGEELNSYCTIDEIINDLKSLDVEFTCTVI